MHRIVSIEAKTTENLWLNVPVPVRTGKILSLFFNSLLSEAGADLRNPGTRWVPAVNNMCTVQVLYAYPPEVEESPDLPKGLEDRLKMFEGVRGARSCFA